MSISDCGKAGKVSGSVSITLGGIALGALNCFAGEQDPKKRTARSKYRIG
jgi:hypothetical protein